MIQHSGTSELGPVRSNNEDFILHYTPEDEDARLAKGHLFVVADGVGGNLAGEVASRGAAEKLAASYGASPKRWGKALQDAFQAANLHIFDLSQSRPEYRKMQTTLSAIVLLNDQAIIGHIGDTRIYQVRGTSIQQVTRDHSEVSELLRMQIITKEEARNHPRRHVITKTIGGEPFVQPEYHNIVVELGDVFVLCTDGLWEPIEAEEIAETVTKYPPSDACRRLIDLAIERETSDNLSVQIAKVTSWDRKWSGAAPKGGILNWTLNLFGKNKKGV